MNERMDLLTPIKKGVSKKQIASFIDSSIMDRLDQYANKLGFGSKRIIIENALTAFMDELDKK